MPSRILNNSLLMGLAPIVFVFLWSTGFIFSKAGLRYAEPFTFLLIRWAAAAVLIFTLTLFIRVQWPARPQIWLHCALVGVLVHGVYLGGVFSAIYRGVDAGLTSLIVGLQPLLTVLFATLWLNEQLDRRKIIGILLGLLGICMVIFQRGVILSGVSQIGLVMCFIALLGIVIGTLYQKKYCGRVDLLPATCIQFVASCAVAAPMAWLFETREVLWTLQFTFIIAWLIIMLSLGAVILLWWLVRHGDAGRVTSYFYLVPPVVAVQAWILFDEHLTSMTLIGMGLCIVGVGLVQKSNL